MTALKDYQMAFTRNIRDPQNTKVPAGVSERGMAAYTEIVFNNIESSVAACFPVLKKYSAKRFGCGWCGNSLFISHASRRFLGKSLKLFWLISTG